MFATGFIAVLSPRLLEPSRHAIKDSSHFSSPKIDAQISDTFQKYLYLRTLEYRSTFHQCFHQRHDEERRNKVPAIFVATLAKNVVSLQLKSPA